MNDQILKDIQRSCSQIMLLQEHISEKLEQIGKDKYILEYTKYTKGLNFECLKLYLQINHSIFIYGITSKIIFDSSINYLKVRPGYHLENEWRDFVYINMKVDNTKNNFDLKFIFEDNNLFWGFFFNSAGCKFCTDKSSTYLNARKQYIRLLYDSNMSKFIAIGNGDNFNEILMEPCDVDCNFFRTWLLSYSSTILISSRESKQYKVEIKGLVVTA